MSLLDHHHWWLTHLVLLNLRVQNEEDLSKKESRNKTHEHPEKDPEVIETLEDTRLSEKLRKEREQKKQL